MNASASPFQQPSSAVVALHNALDMESFWRASVNLLKSELPNRCCTLFYDIVDFAPAQYKYHVVRPRKAEYVPPKSLSVAAPFLARHPRIESYTFSQILAEDPNADQRRLEQEPDPEWNDFVQLAFWQQSQPQAVLGVLGPDKAPISREERAFLDCLHPLMDVGLQRLHTLEDERALNAALQGYLQTSPVALMFFDERGALLFENTLGESQCRRWNRALCKGQELSSLPMALRGLINSCKLAAQDKPRPRGAAPSARLQHPQLPELSVTLEFLKPAQGLGNHGATYVLSFDEEHAQQVPATELSSHAIATLKKLSPTEQRVARLIVEGLRNEDIASKLCRSPRTIEFQLNSIYRKLGISNRVLLARALI